MRVSLLCICLFVFVQILPLQAEELVLEQEVKMCSLDKALDVSKKINRLLQKKEDQLLVLDREYASTLKQYQKLQFSKERLDIVFLEEEKIQKLILTYLQITEPYSLSIEDLKMQNRISSFQTLYHKKMEQDRLYQRKKEELQKLKNKRKILEQESLQYYEFQRILFDRFQKEIQPPDTNYDSFKMIQGIHDLPAYGAIIQTKNEKHPSCLSAGVYEIDSYSSSWKNCVEDGTISAGTWAYPDGRLHLGLDIASSMYSKLYACANGIILYADAPDASNSGYLGNWSGWPAGGGNTICMVVAVEEQLYGITFAHLSNEIYVYPGQQVKQGDVLALTGNSGNSSGPHTHLEIFLLNTDLKRAVDFFIEGADFSFGNGYEEAATCSQIACRIRPESIDWETAYE